MKLFLLLSSLVSASGATAASHSIHNFSCVTATEIETRGYRGETRFQFSVENLEKGRIAYFNADSDSSDPVAMVPEDSVLMLNENFGISRTEKGLKLKSDGDGFQFTNVFLYRDSGYRAGYVKVEFSSDSEKPIYSKVSCTVKTRE